jgi:hypothetical protein
MAFSFLLGLAGAMAPGVVPVTSTWHTAGPVVVPHARTHAVPVAPAHKHVGPIMAMATLSVLAQPET